LKAIASTYTCFPAEWSHQSAILLAWPHATTDWVDTLEQVESVYIELVSAICRHQKAVILCIDVQHESHIQTMLAQHDIDMEQLVFYHVHYNDTWTRDYGPITVRKNRQSVMLDFTFNGWGNKFEATLDNTVNKQLTEAGAWPPSTLQEINYVLEGGSIDSDGLGSLLTTSACLLHPGRNPDYSRKQVESLLGKTLGCTRILWLENGFLIGDDTDSHIDMLARFCDPQTIAYTSCTDEQDEQYAALKQMEMELRQFTTASGHAYRLISLPIPAPIHDKDGQRLPASYANFLIINDAVLMPVYQDQQADKHAFMQLQTAFSDREIIAIDCKPLIMQHGSLHCASMQLLHGVQG
jgi:agmatine deiminase